MSVKLYFFVSSLNKRNLFFFLSERTVFHVLGNREIQTNIDKLIYTIIYDTTRITTYAFLSNLHISFGL